MIRTPANGVTLFNPPSSRMLDSLIARSGFERAQFGETDGPIPEGTKVLLGFGEDSLRMLSGEVGLSRYRGHVLGDSPLRLVTFSPDFLLPKKGEESSTKFTGVVVSDIRKAVRIAKEGFTRLPTNYLLDPSPDVAQNWAVAYSRQMTTSDYLSFDLETPMKTKKQDETEVEELDLNILRVGFSWREREGLTMPWTPEYMEVIKFLLEGSGKKTSWNGKGFDEPVLDRSGVVLGGEHFDAMDFWHVFQPVLPRKLEFVSSFYAEHLLPWKHTAKSEFALYNVKDADAGLCCMRGVERDLRSISIPEIELGVAA